MYDDIENKFLSFHDFCNRTGNVGQIDYLTYNGVLSCIPKKWKTTLTNGINPVDYQNYKSTVTCLIQNPRPSSFFYQRKRAQNETLDAVHKVWAFDLGVPEEELAQQWDKICLAALKTSICPKLKYFQYRVTHRKLTTNYLRNKYDSLVSPLCWYCKHHTETVFHLLWFCPVIRAFWTKLFQWCKYICKIDLQSDIEPFHVILNCYKGEYVQLVNTILLITKQYIYRCKCQKQKLSIMELVTSIYNYQKMEASIAKEKKIYYKHEKKWAILLKVM